MCKSIANRLDDVRAMDISERKHFLDYNIQTIEK